MSSYPSQAQRTAAGCMRCAETLLDGGRVRNLSRWIDATAADLAPDEVHRILNQGRSLGHAAGADNTKTEPPNKEARSYAYEPKPLSHAERNRIRLLEEFHRMPHEEQDLAMIEILQRVPANLVAGQNSQILSGPFRDSVRLEKANYMARLERNHP